MIWKSKSFKPENVLATYAKLQSNGEVLMVDVGKRHKTIREWWLHISDMKPTESHTLIVGKMVYFSGMTMEQRNDAA